MIGLAQGGLLVALRAVLPPAPAAALAVAAAALVTGAFHHDGLADMADAFGGGWTVEQRLAIMKDSRLGTYGTSVLILAFAAEISVLVSLDPWDGFRALVAAHCLSRAVAVVVMRVAPVAVDPTMSSDGGSEADPAPSGGLGAAYASDLSSFGTGAAGLFGLGVTILAFAGTWLAVPAILLAILATVCVVALSIRKIGGITGDVLGAVQQMSALSVLIAAATAATA